jgi:hypothetical protein
VLISSEGLGREKADARRSAPDAFASSSAQQEGSRSIVVTGGSALSPRFSKHGLVPGDVDD